MIKPGARFGRQVLVKYVHNLVYGDDHKKAGQRKPPHVIAKCDCGAKPKMVRLSTLVRAGNVGCRDCAEYGVGPKKEAIYPAQQPNEFIRALEAGHEN